MNQIICNFNSESTSSNTKQHKKNFFEIVFSFLFILSIFLIFYYLYYRYDLHKSERISRTLLDNFNITNLYMSNNNYSATRTSNIKNTYNLDDISGSVIGIIEIEKLNISYPILSNINKKLLKISPCRFAGPYPNEIGNLCIAAHNYKNETFFSKISTLKNGDIITIYDIYGNVIYYLVYDVYTSSFENTECLNQDTNNLRVITLITCNSLDNHYRTIVKAKEYQKKE